MDTSKLIDGLAAAARRLYAWTSDDPGATSVLRAVALCLASTGPVSSLERISTDELEPEANRERAAAHLVELSRGRARPGREHPDSL